MRWVNGRHKRQCQRIGVGSGNEPLHLPAAQRYTSPARWPPQHTAKLSVLQRDRSRHHRKRGNARGVFAGKAAGSGDEKLPRGSH